MSSNKRGGGHTASPSLRRREVPVERGTEPFPITGSDGLAGGKTVEAEGASQWAGKNNNCRKE